MQRPLLATTAILLLLLVGSGAALAQSGSGFDLSWHRIAGGGGLGSTGSGFQVSGTGGQPEAGTASGSGYTLLGGFWGVAAQAATSTPTPTATPTGTLTPAATPTGTLTPAATPTGTLTPATPTPTATPCVLADINCDGMVDLMDYAAWRMAFGAMNCGRPADLNGDCLVDIRDYGIWRQNFGHTAGGAAPETATRVALPLGTATPTPMSSR